MPRKRDFEITVTVRNVPKSRPFEDYGTLIAVKELLNERGIEASGAKLEIKFTEAPPVSKGERALELLPQLLIDAHIHLGSKGMANFLTKHSVFAGVKIVQPTAVIASGERGLRKWAKAA